jgi:hypothetical protein
MSCFIFNWLIYYSSIIISQGVYVSCYIAPILTACQLFKFYLPLMCIINCIEQFFSVTWLTLAHNNPAPALRARVSG